MDTKTGQLCYTSKGVYTSALPAIQMCADLVKNHPDSN